MDTSKTPEQGKTSKTKKISGKIVNIAGKATLASGLMVLSHGAVAGAAEPVKSAQTEVAVPANAAPIEYNGGAGGPDTYVDTSNNPTTTTPTTSPETEVPVSVPEIPVSDPIDETVKPLDPTPTTVANRPQVPVTEATTTTIPYNGGAGGPGTYVNDGHKGSTTTTYPITMTTQTPTSTVENGDATNLLAHTTEHDKAPAEGKGALIGTLVGGAALGLANLRKNAQQNQITPNHNNIPSA